jgi:hypothetical protein
MSDDVDERLQHAYRQFRCDHDSLRDDLLATLPPVPERDVVRAGKWIAWNAAATASARWAAGLAAACLLVVLISLILLRSPTPAYALDDVVGRLASCHSIETEGWILIDGVRYPHRMYVEEPGFYWYTTLATQGDKTTMGVSASDGARYIRVDDRDKTFETGKEIPLAAELMTRMLIQMALPEQVIGREVFDHKKTGTEIVRGILTDLYELPSPAGGRRVICVDPASGLPLRSAVYEHVKGEDEKQVMAFNIIPNATRPAQGLSFEPPAGYAVTRRDRKPQTSIGVGSGTSGPESAGVLMALNIEDRAILLCWTHYVRTDDAIVETDLDGAVGRLLPLRVESIDGRLRYQAYHLRADPWDEGHHARWSLLVPQNRRAGIGNAAMIVENQRMHFRCEFSPLRFEKGRLASVVVETQKLLLSPDASPDAILDLERLLELERKLRHAE